MVGYYISLPCSVVTDYRCEVKPFLTGTVDPRKDMEIKCELPFHYTQWFFLNFLIFFSLMVLCKLVCLVIREQKNQSWRSPVPGVFGVTCWAHTSPWACSRLLLRVKTRPACLRLSSQPRVIACFIPDLTLQHLPILHKFPWCHCCPYTLWPPGLCAPLVQTLLWKLDTALKVQQRSFWLHFICCHAGVYHWGTLVGSVYLFVFSETESCCSLASDPILKLKL